MTTNYVNAVDEMFKQFNDAWQANSGAIVGYIPQVFWQGVEEDNAPPADKVWARVSQQTVVAEQTNVAVQGENGKRRYTDSGLLFVQIFYPLSSDQSMYKLRLLAQVAKAAFRGKTTASGVLFRNVKASELSPDAKSNRLNVVAEYEYDEIT